ncbi:MAG: hypothetical protein AAGF31_01860 [Planctomycetota bacterium]
MTICRGEICRNDLAIVGDAAQPSTVCYHTLLAMRSPPLAAGCV